MKKVLSLAIMLSLMLCSTSLHCSEEPLSHHDYDTNDRYPIKGPLGLGSSQAVSKATSTSMMAWGFGLATGIAILAGVIHQSAAAHTTESTDSSGS